MRCFKILKEIAQTLGDGFDVEIVELHHNKKKDSPSGTAVKMGEIVADALGRCNSIDRSQRITTRLRTVATLGWRAPTTPHMYAWHASKSTLKFG